MPTVTRTIREVSRIAGRNIVVKLPAPLIKNVTEIRIFRAGSLIRFTPTNLSFSVDLANQTVDISGGYVPTSSVENTTQPKLTGSSVSGNTRTCRYEGGHTRQIRSDGICGGFITVKETIYSYDYNIEVDYSVNNPPAIASDTPDLDALYEGDTYTVKAEVMEPDADDVVNVYYQINDDVPRVFGFFTSESEPLFTERTLTYRNGQLIDDETETAVVVPEGVMHTVKIWAEDDYGGKSDVLEKEFAVDSNQPPQITVNPFSPVSYLLDNEQVAVTGSVMDPNGGVFTLSYQLDEGPWFDAYTGTDSPFSIALPLPLLTENSRLLIRAVDEFGAMDEQAVNVSKELIRHPRLESDMRYRINIPSRKAQVITLKVIREIGDLAVTATVSMTGGEADELFVAMTKTGTQPAGEGLEEDTFTYTAAEPMEKILFGLTMTRQQASSTQKITRISGTLN